MHFSANQVEERLRRLEVSKHIVSLVTLVLYKPKRSYLAGDRWLDPSSRSASGTMAKNRKLKKDAFIRLIIL